VRYCLAPAKRVFNIRSLDPTDKYFGFFVRRGFSSIGILFFVHAKLEARQPHLYTLSAFDNIRDWQRDELFSLCQRLAVAMELKFRDFRFPLFIATSGRAVSLPLFDSWNFLGADMSRARLRSALEALGVSNKERKRLDKEYQALRTAMVPSDSPAN